MLCTLFSLSLLNDVVILQIVVDNHRSGDHNHTFNLLNNQFNIQLKSIQEDTMHGFYVSCNPRIFPNHNKVILVFNSCILYL